MITEFAPLVGYYDRDGSPMELMDWAKKCASLHRLVANTGFGPDGSDGWVSTIWSGLPPAILHQGIPLIFETMVFAEGTKLHHRRWFHPTLDAAIMEHDLVAMLLGHELGPRVAEDRRVARWMQGLP